MNCSQKYRSLGKALPINWEWGAQPGITGTLAEALAIGQQIPKVNNTQTSWKSVFTGH